MERKFDIEESLLKSYLDAHLTYAEIAKKHGCSHWTVMKIANEKNLHSKARKHQMKENNPAAMKEVREKISNSVSKCWEEGKYALRGTGEKIEKSVYDDFGGDYNAKAKYFHPEPVCYCCGKKLSWTVGKKGKNRAVVHHVDRNHENIGLSNLKVLCSECHAKQHLKETHFVTITKAFSFDACHFLPYHDRRCKFLHGHTYHMEISVRDVIQVDTGFVLDFGVLKKAVQEFVVDKFDHGFLNEYLEYPTCENMCKWIWAQLSPHIKGLSLVKVQETDGSYCTFSEHA